jgi:hypothetical protein
MKKYCVLLILPLFFITIFDKPERIIVRGPIVLKQYYEGGWIGGHAKWPWTITIDGDRFALPGTDIKEFGNCYTGPNEEIPVVLIWQGLDWYMLRVTGGSTDIKKLPITTWDSRSWTEDGRFLVIKREKDNLLLDVVSGRMAHMPGFPARFLCFSPDMRTIVSVETKEIDGVYYRIVYQTDVKTGKTVAVTVAAYDYPWLGDWTHFSKYESTPNIWIASHFRWKKRPDGTYELLLK